MDFISNHERTYYGNKKSWLNVFLLFYFYMQYIFRLLKLRDGDAVITRSTYKTKLFNIIMKKVSQPSFISSQLTIETLEQGVKLESLGSFWCLYC